MRKQPNPGLRSFIFRIAAISSGEGPLGPGLRRRAKARPIFSIYQRSVESEQSCGFDECAKLRNALSTHE